MMDTARLFDTERRSRAPLVFALCLALLAAATLAASALQRDFGRVAVENRTYLNEAGTRVRAKLLRPAGISQGRRVPGVLWVHGYQNNRETSDAFAIELARRGMAVLAIDAIGRGNSGVPADPEDPGFDPTYGARASLAYLRRMPFVDPQAVAAGGPRLGAEIAYRLALADRGISAAVITGFAYDAAADGRRPRNLLMIFGKYDEFRRRMTGTGDFAAEWFSTALSRRVLGAADPRPGVTYGAFADGTARRVAVPPVSHLHTSHSRAAVAEAADWLRQALDPPAELWIPAGRQIWPLKELATLAAMLAGLAALLPLTLMLLRARFFAPLQGPAAAAWHCPRRDWLRGAALNAVLTWLYFPLIFALFGIHVYLVRIDRAFPMMMVNGVLWWFLWANLIGFFAFRRWYRKPGAGRPNLLEAGLSFAPERFALAGVPLAKTALLAAILFGFAYLAEHTLERMFIVDWRFVFPFASDLTAYRAGLWLVYFPWLLIGFGLLGIQLHARLRPAPRRRWWQTWLAWSAANLAVLLVPAAVLLLVQYGPLWAGGGMPLVGPGGMLVAFTHNLLHVAAVLLLVVPLSTWCFQLTGRIYLGALVNAALVAWMFAASQVVAPVPV